MREACKSVAVTVTAFLLVIGLAPLSDAQTASLLEAALQGDLATVKGLIKRGADPNAKNNAGETALMLAAMRAHRSTVQALLDAGADVNARDKEGMTAFSVAILGANMHRAKDKDFVPTIELLLDRGANVNEKFPEKYEGLTALMVAAGTGQIHLIQALLKRGADVNARDKYGGTALVHGMGIRGIDGTIIPASVVGILLDAGADVDAGVGAQSGGPPLIEAIFHGRFGWVDRSVVTLLLDRGANVNARDRDGDTALMIAASGRDADTVRELLRRGADINAKNPKGETALTLARKKGHREIVQLLSQAGEAAKTYAVQSFIQRAKVEQWLGPADILSQFGANPLPWKGKVVGFVGEFGGMLSEDSAVFNLGLMNFVVIRRLPSTRFTRSGEKALIAARVMGITQVSLPLLGTGPAPELSFIAVDPVRASSAGEVLPAVKPQSRSEQAEDRQANINACPGLQKSPYSLVLNREVYEVGKINGATPVFLKNGSMPVRDPALARELAKAAWAYENIIKSPSALQGKSNVSMFLNTYKGIRRWEITQDILARAFVEATVAGITGGASLGKTIPGLTWGVVRDQFVANLEFYLALMARRGLEKALAHYQEIEKLSSRSSGSKIDAKIAGQIYDLYQEAHTLELKDGALLVSLMPKTGLDLVNRAVGSVRNQLLQGLPIKNDPFTVGDAFTLLDLIAKEMNSYPPLREFSEKWSLAKRLVQANGQTIARWADEATRACPTTAQVLPGSESTTSRTAPPVPYEDHGACPFEGCVYREWVASKDIAIRKDRSENSAVAFTVRKGERVVALTGVVVTTKPDQAKVLKSLKIGGIQADPGNIVYLLTNRGEGAWKVWFKGRIIDHVAIDAVEPDEVIGGRYVNSRFQIIDQGRHVWWVKIKNSKGQEGWTQESWRADEPANFDNKDRFS